MLDVGISNCLFLIMWNSGHMSILQFILWPQEVIQYVQTHISSRVQIFIEKSLWDNTASIANNALETS